VDVTVHEKNPDGTLKELHSPSGGPWGGTYVDENFIKWLSKFFGEVTIKQFKENSMDDFIDLLREFEMKKRNVCSDSQDPIVFKLSLSLLESHKESGDENIAGRIARMNLSEDIKIKKDKLHVSVAIVRSWFKEPIDNTVSHIVSILSEPAMKDVGTVLLVGGFGGCQLAQEEIRNAVGSRTVLIPAEAGLAVLKGAVQFGHQPRLVTSRCMTYTYGFAVSRSFNCSKHPKEKMTVNSYGYKIIDKCFKRVITKGMSVEVGKEIKMKNFICPRKISSILDIFASTEQKPEYTTDPSCRRVGTLDLGYAPGETVEENSINIYFTFGDTELKASVEILKTGEVLTKIIECL